MEERRGSKAPARPPGGKGGGTSQPSSVPYCMVVKLQYARRPRYLPSCWQLSDHLSSEISLVPPAVCLPTYRPLPTCFLTFTPDLTFSNSRPSFFNRCCFFFHDRPCANYRPHSRQLVVVLFFRSLPEDALLIRVLYSFPLLGMYSHHVDQFFVLPRPFDLPPLQRSYTIPIIRLHTPYPFLP